MTHKSLSTLSIITVISIFTSATNIAHAADDAGRLSIIEENDYFASDDDKHYTQGLRLSYLSGPVSVGGYWDDTFTFLSNITPAFSDSDHKRKYSALLGQSIFTPTNIHTAAPQVRDRPYVAWLYTGVSLLQENKQPSHNTLENAELQIGTVGRWALGSVTQNDYHQFINIRPALGWQNELKNEPGLIATYERKWRFQQPIYSNLAVDAIPDFGVSAGNILTYGQGGVLLRFGQNLAADYGPAHIRPSLSGTDWFDADQLDGDLGWYLFAGTQGRAVAHNIFLDGNTFSQSAHVEKKPLVADFMIGASLFWSNAVRFDFSVIQRTDEFFGQSGHPDRFGGLNLTFKFF